MLQQANRDKPVLKERICGEFRVDDRKARKMIEDLRDGGHPVVGTSDTKGYWIAKSEAEMEMFIRNYTSKARTIQKRAERMNRTFYQEKVREDLFLGSR